MAANAMVQAAALGCRAELLTVLHEAAHLDDADRVLLCGVGGATFGLPLTVVQEVVPVPRLRTALQAAPPVSSQ